MYLVTILSIIYLSISLSLYYLSIHLSINLSILAGAMQAITSKGVVHRDLKPQNILLAHDGKSR